MKTKISRIGKKSLSLVIVLMMIVSTMLVGMVTTSAADYFTPGSTFYFKTGASASWWENDSAETYIKFVQDGSSNYAWVKLTKSSDGTYYSGNVPSSGTYNILLFVRAKSSLNTSNIWDSTNIINYTASLRQNTVGTNNCFTVTSSSSSGTVTGTWSEYSGGSTTYTVTKGTTSNGSFSVSSTSAAEGATVTVTTTPNSGYEVDTVTYTPDGGSATTVSGSSNTYKFTMPAANVTVNVSFKTTSSSSTTYYVTGRFRVKDASGNESKLEWNKTNMTDPFKFQPVSGQDGVYSLETNCTLKELSEQIACTGYSAYQFFYIYDGTNLYNAKNTSLQDVTESSPQALVTGGLDEDMRFSAVDDTSTDKVTLMLDTNGMKLWYTTDGATTTVGKFTIKDKTTLNGSLSFSAEGKKAGTADAGDVVTVTPNPNAGFSCTGITVTAADKSTVEATESDGKYTFTMPAQNVTVAGTFALDKAAYIKDTDALWIDVAPNESDSSATLIKWNNYQGSSHGSRTSYYFYVPKNVDLTNAKIYNGFSSAVTLNGVTIPANSCNSDTLSLDVDKAYTPSGATTNQIKVKQGSTDAMFLYTTNSSGNAYNLPTKVDSSLTSKDSVKAEGGTCKTMTNDDTTATFSSAMALDTVKGRGNSSWEASYKLFGKYAFNMKLDSKTKLFGMDSAKSWCLLANNADESMLRNALTYQLAAEIGIKDSPEFRFVDIYDNGEYMGQYLVTEKVDVGNSKLVKGESFDDINEETIQSIYNDTTKKVDETKIKTDKYSYNGNTYTMSYATVDSKGTSSYPTDTRGTYLLEFEIASRYDDETSYFQSPRGQYVVVKSPEFATKEQVTYIAQKFAAMEDKIFTSDTTSTATKAELSTVMDVESFAKMYLIQEFSSNLDSAATSYYITFDCSQSTPVFVANPVWDYDWAYGQYEKNEKESVTGSGVASPLDTDNPEAWYAKTKKMGDDQADKYSIQSMLANNNSAFKTVVRKVWEETGGFYDTIQKYYGTDSQIDTWYNQIKDSVDMNETRWGFIASDPLITANWGSKDTGDTHSDTVNYLKNTWTSKRAAWLNTKFTSSTQTEYLAYTPDAPTINAYAADGTTAITAVEQGTGFIIKVTSDLESGVVYRLYRDGVQVSTTDRSDGKFEIASDSLTVGTTYEYTIKAVFNGNESAASTAVSVTINDKAGNKQVTILFKSSSASAYVPSLSVDGATAAVMTRDKKTAESDGTYFGSTYSGSLKFYWFYTTMTLDTSVEHTLKFTTKDNRVNASTSYKFGSAADSKYYFAVDNLMGDTELVDLTGKEEYIRNYHISATHMVHSTLTEYDNGVGFTWVDGKEYAMGTYLSQSNEITTESLTDLTSASLLTIPSALSPNAMLQASSASTFFTIKSATLAQSIAAEIEEVSTLQYQLLDVNLDGKVDVKDSTMMQKALVIS